MGILTAPVNLISPLIMDVEVDKVNLDFSKRSKIIRKTFQI